MAIYGRSQPPRVISSRGGAASVVVATRTINAQRLVLVTRGIRYGHVYRARNPLVPPAPFLAPAPKVHVFIQPRYRKYPGKSYSFRNPLVPPVILALAPKIHIVSLVTNRNRQQTLIKILRTKASLTQAIALWINTWP